MPVGRVRVGRHFGGRFRSRLRYKLHTYIEHPSQSSIIRQDGVGKVELAELSAQLASRLPLAA